MKKMLIVAALAITAPAAIAQFPGIKLDTKAVEQAAKKDADKAAKEAEKAAKKDADKAAKAALKANLVDTLALPRGDAKAPTTFLSLSAALASAELDKALKGPGPFTLFAPSDAAFAKIPEADLAALLADKAKLTALLQGHVVAGAVPAKAVKAGKVKTLGGAEVDVAIVDGKVSFGGANVVMTDIEATNGVVHVIDTVVMPKP